MRKICLANINLLHVTRLFDGNIDKKMPTSYVLKKDALCYFDFTGRLVTFFDNYPLPAYDEAWDIIDDYFLRNSDYNINGTSMIYMDYYSIHDKVLISNRHFREIKKEYKKRRKTN